MYGRLVETWLRVAVRFGGLVNSWALVGEGMEDL
jgi:hypothetical protein